MAMGGLRTAALWLFFGLFSSVVSAAVPDKFSDAVAALKAGDAQAALQQLTELSEAGSRDPRVYYFRGIAAAGLNQSPDADFKKGAALEAATGNSRAVNTALESVQGELRQKIERFRAQGRAAANPNAAAAAQRQLFREALELRRTGKLPEAAQKLQELTETGSDPRYFYLHGIVLSEQGDEAAAKARFSDALQRETTPNDIKLVNEMLSGLSVATRQMVEKNAVVQVGDQTVTRREMHTEIRRRALLTEEQLLAEANKAAAQEEQAEKNRIEASRRAAVADILKQREQQMAKEQAVLAATGAAKPEQPEMQDEPAPAVAATVPSAAVKPATPTTPATPTKPAVADAPKKTSANPFLGGAVKKPAAGVAASRPSSSLEPINLSWMPANMELMVVLRPGDILNSGLGKSLLSDPAAMAAFSQAMPGMQPTDIESITMGFGSIVATMLPVITQAAAGTQPDPAQLTKQLAGPGTVAVVRLSKDVDIKAMAAAVGATEKSAGSASYFVMKSPQEGAPDTAIHAVDAKTLLTGSEAGVQAALKAGAGEATRDNFSFAGNGHVVFGFSSPALVGLSAGIPDPAEGMPPQVAAISSAIKGKILGAAIGVDFSNDLDLTITLQLTEEDAAKEAGKALGEGLMLVKQMGPLLAGGAPPDLAPGLMTAMSSLANGGRGDTLTLSAKLPSALLDALKAQAQNFAPQLQGLPGGPGGPGGSAFPGAPGAPPAP